MPKTVAEKLLIEPGATLWVSDHALLERLGPLPGEVSRVDQPAEGVIAVLFAPNETSLRDTLQQVGPQLDDLATLWVAYPKGNRADINRDTLWPILGEYKKRPISQVAIDDTWSALRFRPLKEGEEQFSPTSQQ